MILKVVSILIAFINVKSNQFQWHLDKPEFFHFLGSSFDVQQAKGLIVAKPRKIYSSPIAGVVGVLGPSPQEKETSKVFRLGVSINWERAETEQIDLTFPIILVHWRENVLPIDGWHRIGKAKMQGKVELPCVMLNRQESRKVTL